MERRDAVRFRRALAGAVTAAVLAAAATAITLGAVGPFASSAAASGPVCGSVPVAGKGELVVAVVVDFGGAAGPVLVDCLAVPDGSSGTDVLAARAALLDKASPRYASSGLLCAIDGYPKTGCGVQTGTHFAYWAYFHGGPSWTYANSGPASETVQPGDVEGWRFEPDGSATPQDPAPRAPSSPSVLEGISGSPTTTVVSTTTTPPGTTSTTRVGAGGTTPTTATSGTSAPGTATTGPGSSTSGTPPTSRANAGAGASTTVAGSTNPVGTKQVGTAASGAAAVGPSVPHGGGSSGTTGLVVGLVAIGLVGGAALVLGRRRARGLSR